MTLTAQVKEFEKIIKKGHRKIYTTQNTLYPNN